VRKPHRAGPARDVERSVSDPRLVDAYRSSVRVGPGDRAYELRLDLTGL
jgi:hypothetical protein